ncbi:MAG TPA: hypothetical protein PLZ36_08735, partial [Armatimonadota bacterium]|nr:hypothetical protein [Armatimonadota bacterium]
MRHTPGWFRLILFVLVLICGLPGWTAAAKRFDEARQVTGLMQEQLALLGDTTGGMLADAVAYAQALGATDPVHLQAKRKPR